MMKKINVWKPYAIGMAFEFLFAWILVMLFRSSYDNSSVLGDVVQLVLIFWGIQLFFAIKNGIYAIIISNLYRKDAVDLYLETFIKNKMPEPNQYFHVDDPDIYLRDAMEDTSLSGDARVVAATLFATQQSFINTGKYLGLYLFNKTIKELLKRYLHHCSKLNSVYSN